MPGCFVFLLENQTNSHQPLYEAIVFEAKKQSLSGATVTRGIMGFGANSKIHTAKLFDISTDLPVIVEIVDTLEKNKNSFKNSRTIF